MFTSQLQILDIYIKHEGVLKFMIIVEENLLIGLTLVMIRGKYTFVMMGGGDTKCPPIFIDS